jgi:4-hydroxy-4-methyl-2-oxoglutarate aldolase
MNKEPTQLTLRVKFPRPTAAQIVAFKDVPTGFVCDAMDGVGGMKTTISPLFEAHIADCAVVGDNCSGVTWQPWARCMSCKKTT